MHYSSALV